MEVWIFSIGEAYEGSTIRSVYTTEEAARSAMIATAQGEVASRNESTLAYINSEPDHGYNDWVPEELEPFDPEKVTCISFGCDYYVIQKYEVQV